MTSTTMGSRIVAAGDSVWHQTLLPALRVLRVAAMRHQFMSVCALACACCLFFGLAIAAANAETPPTVREARGTSAIAVVRLAPPEPEFVRYVYTMEEKREPIVKPARHLKTRMDTWTDKATGSSGKAASYSNPATSPLSGRGRYVYIPNSYVNNYVAQGSDNSYYLTHAADGSYNSNGSIYAHYRNNLSSVSALSRNTVLFGHNKSLSRFSGNLSNLGSILRFQDYDYAAARRTITLTINGETATFVIFAALDCEVRNDRQNFYYWQTNPSDSSWSSILSQAKDRSYWDYGVDVSTSDKVLTLSTCSYDWGYDSGYNTYAKFVVMARMLRSGESVSGFPGITANSGRRTPAGLTRW